MKIHLSQIPAEGVHVEGEDPASILELREGEGKPLTPVHYALDIGRSGSGVFATGRLWIDLERTCVGCLEQFAYPLRVAEFACQKELDGPEEIDLTEPMKEDILLALPAHPRCDWSGSKQCPGVQRPAAAEPEEGESRPDVWGALDQLKIK